MKPAIIIGTRPEIIKLMPVCRKLKDCKVYFTGQHYSEDMGAAFFKELGVKVDSQLVWGGLGQSIIDLTELLKQDGITHVIVQGDTNSVLAGAIAGRQLGLQVVHLEAGLRSNDKRMMEEYNRIVVDHISDYLFAPSKIAVENLRREGIVHGVFNVGNTIVDAVHLCKDNSSLDIPSDYALLTLHRAENVDCLDHITTLLDGVLEFKKKTNLKIIFPVHPRTKNKLIEFNMWEDISHEFVCMKPLSFCDTLYVEKNAKIIFTDSGGIQEEACILNKPCVTLRLSTERPETVDIGANVITGYSSKKVLSYGLKMLDNKKKWKCPYGDGKASEKVIKILER